MGREVRMVPPDWQHPKNKWTGRHEPLHPREYYIEWVESSNEHPSVDAGDQITEFIFMPHWAPGRCTHFQMYETCSEGTPISPVMETKEELARWLADSGASAFADLTATYEQWLATIEQGSSVSAAIVGGRLVSGVELNTEATHGQ